MPVLGGSSSSGAGTAKQGVFLPAGSLDIAKAAALACGTTRTEWVIFGDSTSAGSATGSPNTYSWITRLRARLAADYTDGGRGVIGGEDAGVTTLDAIDSISGVATDADAWAGGGTNNDPLLVSSFGKTTVNSTVTFQGYATSARVHFGRRGDRGGFTYSANGGAETTVEADTNGFSCDSLLITGLPSATLNTVTIKNLGTALVRQPTTFTAGAGTGGTLAAGTYFYKVTAVDSAGGQTLPTASATTTLGVTGTVSGLIGGTRSDSTFTNATSYKVYRSATSGGTYQLIATVTNAAGDGNQAWSDDGSATAGASAPTAATSGRNVISGRAGTTVAVDMLKSTGITVHKQAQSGISSNNYFGYANSQNYGSFQAQIALGLVPGVASPLATDVCTAQASRPQYRSPSLAIFALGINDMQGITVAAGSGGQPTTAEQDAANRAIQFYANAIEHFIKLARNAGADPLVVIPHFKIAQYGHFFGGAFISAAAGVCAAHGVAMVDFNTALGPINQMAAAGYSVAVHTNKAAYDAEADFLYAALRSYFTAA